MKVVVITSVKGSDNAPPPTLPELVIVRDMVRRGHEVVFVAARAGRFTDVLLELGIEVIVRSYAATARSVWKRAARFLGAGSLARKYADADCVVSFRLSSTLLALDLGKRIGIPVMTFLHGHTDRAQKYLNHGCHQTDLVGAVSSAALHAYDVATRGVRPSEQSLELILNGIDDEEFRARADELDARAACGIPKDVPLVGMVGAVDRGTAQRKGIDVFVKAAAQLAGKHPDTHYVVCGSVNDEELRLELAQIAKDAGCSDRLHWAGWQDNIGAFMKASDIWAMPSRNDAFPLVGLEVAAAGRPIVASAVGGIPEMIVDRETGFLIPPDDVNVLAARLDTLLGDRSLREEMGSRATQFVRAELSLERQVNRFEECLQSIMKRSSRTQSVNA